mmetsp:Transcript_1192/g.4345  ORF Transcript_1192/g.4345 Transcript_1192/m.4345 type:complete len:263 (+) Transcript_1192:75-863(+)
MAARRAGVALAGAAGGFVSAKPADCRAARTDNSPSNSQLLVSDGSAAWSLEDGCGKDSWLLLPGEVADAAAHLLEPENDRSIISAAEVDDVQRQVLGLAARLAQKPEVQRALLQELGLEGDAPTSLLLPAGEESTAVLRQIVAQLKLENEALQAANVAAREKLAASDGDSAHKTMIRQLEAQNAALQLMSSTNSLEADWQDPARDVHDLFETLGRGTDCDEQDADGAGAAVAAACADGASARAVRLYLVGCSPPWSSAGCRW